MSKWKVQMVINGAQQTAESLDHVERGDYEGASENGNLFMIRLQITKSLLIKHRADVNARDGGHNAPLHLALSSWRPENVRLLLKHDADVNARDGGQRTPLHLASSQYEELLMLMATQRAQSEMRVDEKADEKADIVQVLIQHRADVAAQDNTRSTPLYLASSNGCGRTIGCTKPHLLV